MLRRILTSIWGWGKVCMKSGDRTLYLNRQRHLPFRVQSTFELKSLSCHLPSDLSFIIAAFSALYLMHLHLVPYISSTC